MYDVHKVTPPPFQGTMREKSKVFVTLQKVNKRSRSKQQVLCTNSSSYLTVETMINGQCQTVQYVMVSTR